MGKILCAIRGGEASYKTQDAAIELAKDTGDELVFMFAVDTEFLDKTARAYRRDAIEKEMDHMGEFLLLMALERAKKQDIKASLVIRHGDFLDELVDVAMDPDIHTLVFGKPAGENSLFTLEELQSMAQEVGEQTNTKILIT